MSPTARFLSLALACSLVARPTWAQSERATALARSAIVVDTHIDVPYRLQDAWVDVTGPTADGDYDDPRARKGGLNVVFMSIYTPAEIHPQEGGHFQLANELIDSVEAIACRAPDRYAVVTGPEEARAAFQAGRIAMALGMENGSPIGTDLGKLAFFHDRGVRYITLAHSKANAIADSSYDENRPNGGLSEFGRAVVAEMNRLGIMIDISHLSDEAASQVLEISTAPVIASHSSARRFTPGWERNISDALIGAVAGNGGVIGVNFGSTFLTAEANAWSRAFNALREEKRTELEDDAEALAAWEASYRAETPYPFADVDAVLDHIDHIVKLAGIDHVGIGSDFDGVGNSLPAGLKDVSGYPNLIAGLLARGYDEPSIRKILGENFLRVWGTVQSSAERRKSGPQESAP